MTLINNTLKEGYKYAILLNLQQKGSKLSDCVRVEQQNINKTFYDQIGPTEAIDITRKQQDTPLLNTKFDRRFVTLVTSDWGDLVENEAHLTMLTDPTSAYALNAAYALGRKKDIRIIEAALGNAWSGNNGDSPISMLGMKAVEVDYTEGSQKTATGLTIQKLRKARELLDDADVDDDEEQYCVVTSKQVSDLLRTTEVTSEDYNSVKALVDGKIDTFMGFKFKRVSSAILPISGFDKVSRSVLCFAKSGLLMGINNDIKVDISPRPDKRMATQVYASISCGAVRMSEKKVVPIYCKE